MCSSTLVELNICSIFAFPGGRVCSFQATTSCAFVRTSLCCRYFGSAFTISHSSSSNKSQGVDLQYGHCTNGASVQFNHCLQFILSTPFSDFGLSHERREFPGPFVFRDLRLTPYCDAYFLHSSVVELSTRVVFETILQVSDPEFQSIDHGLPIDEDRIDSFYHTFCSLNKRLILMSRFFEQSSLDGACNSCTLQCRAYIQPHLDSMK